MNYDIESVKKMIVNQFNVRTNDLKDNKIDFDKNQDVLDSIARTYMYYKSNFTDKIDISKIAGSDRFERMLNKSIPDNMANLYLERLLLNMLEIGEITTVGVKGEAANNGIYFNKNLMNEQIKFWKKNVLFSKQDLDVLKGNEKIVVKNLNDKAVIHELAHMSAKPTIFAAMGFSNGTRAMSKQTCASRFEEVCAEATALNVTRQKIPSIKKIKGENIEVQIGGYNPESSNYPISSFIELAPFAFGKKELEMGRLINPEAYMEELNSKYSQFARDGGTFAGRLQDDLKAIVDKNEYGRLPKLQADFINIGMERISQPNYLGDCDEKQFKQDVGFMLRMNNLLYRRYENGKLQSTQNVVSYNKAMPEIEKIFNYLKIKRNMFEKYNSFEEFKAEGLTAITNRRRVSLGLRPINKPNQNADSVNHETVKISNINTNQKSNEVG